jgi:hypothetical protein
MHLPGRKGDADSRDQLAGTASPANRAVADFASRHERTLRLTRGSRSQWTRGRSSPSTRLRRRQNVRPEPARNPPNAQGSEHRGASEPAFGATRAGPPGRVFWDTVRCSRAPSRSMPNLCGLDRVGDRHTAACSRQWPLTPIPARTSLSAAESVRTSGRRCVWRRVGNGSSESGCGVEQVMEPFTARRPPWLCPTG